MGRRTEAAALPTRRSPRAGARALQILKAVAEALNSAPTEQLAAAEALSRMADLVGVRTGWVWLHDPGSDRFYSAAAQGLPPYLQEPVRMTGQSCWCLDQFRNGRLTAGNIDVLGCSRLSPAIRAGEIARTGGLRCHASVPVYAGDRPLGVMNLAMPGWRRLTRQELDLLTTIADQVGVAVERARLGEQSIEHARADERARLARDVHDTLAQGFTAIALHIENALTGIPPRGRASLALRKALGVARQGVDQARGAIRQLRASPLDDRPLPEALATLSRRFTADTGVRVRLEASPVGPLSPDVESELYRIASEALANVRKHAHATEVHLALDLTRGRLRLTISDNGTGFRLQGARLRGFGMIGMQDRARAIGGRVSVRTEPGAGTTVAAMIPAASPKRRSAGRARPGTDTS